MALWTMQQLRTALPADHPYRFLIHDRDAIFSLDLNQGIRQLGIRVLKTPPQSPQANAICERLLGTLRRECLDFLIPLTEHHLRRECLDFLSLSPSTTCGVSCTSGFSTTTQVARTWPWVQESRSRLHTCLCLCKRTGTDFQRTCE